jgi:hypothetical protein
MGLACIQTLEINTKIFVEKYEGKRLFGRLGQRWDNIKMDLKKQRECMYE